MLALGFPITLVLFSPVMRGGHVSAGIPASAWLLLDQVPSAGETAGGLMLVVGVLVAMRSRRAPAPQTAEPERVGAAQSTQ